MELADTSAWTNRNRNPEARNAFNELVEAGEIATCDMVRLELLWSTRNIGEFKALREELASLESCEMGPEVWRRAIDVFESLAALGPLHHRQVKLPDLIIAAAAEAVGLAVCHYDADFEVISGVTGQKVRAIAPIGSL